MEFGLQKADKMESPVLMGNPRKRIEAKAYRARDRMDSGWFRHDAGTPDNSPNVSPAASPLPGTGGRSKQLLGNLCVHCSGDKQQLLKLQQLTMPAGVRSGSLNRGQSPKKIASSGAAAARLQQQIYANCSDWYRHEHTIITGDTDEEQKNADQCHSPIPTWRHKDEKGGGSGQFSPRSRRVCAEAEEYWKRNHDGSVKEWFKHEHTLMVEKENEFADLSEVCVSPAASPIITNDGQGCYLCGQVNLSPAKATNKKACQQVLTERF